IKISSAVNSTIGLFLLPIGLLAWDRARAWRMALLGIIAAPLLFVAAYLLYNPSLVSLWRYLRSAVDISSKDITVMSQTGGEKEITIALVLLAGYVVFTAALLWTRRRSACLAVAGLGALFIE